MGYMSKRYKNGFTSNNIRCKIIINKKRSVDPIFYSYFRAQCP